jgi:hypothetical protein
VAGAELSRPDANPEARRPVMINAAIKIRGVQGQTQPLSWRRSARGLNETGWWWDEDRTRLRFRLREGVRRHDGSPFTAKDVQCAWDLLTGKSSEKLRINPRKGWYRNLEEITTNGDFEVTLRLKRPCRLLPGSPRLPLPRIAA